MADPSSSSPATTPDGSNKPPKFSRGDSNKRSIDGRRDRFKDRGKDLERGVSTPALFGAGSAAPLKAPLPLNEDEAITVGQGMGHQFMKKTFFQPTYCQHCSELLWGLKGQGYLCEGNLAEVIFS